MLQNKLNRVCRYIMDQFFRVMDQGQLTMVLPDGEKHIYGDNAHGLQATMKVNNDAFFRKCIRFGAVGFGESYVDGDWEADDLTRVISWMLLNHENLPAERALRKEFSVVNFLNGLNIIRSKYRSNTLRGSRKNISDHYDLGNDFFQIFLDKTMTYSSAIFTANDQSLEEAQIEKYDRLCRKLKITKDDHVLEIGSGWGSFSCYAAKTYGCRVTTTTISAEQYQLVSQKIKHEGLEGRVNILMSDYRDLTGTYDKLVSIEMIEAVGHEFLPVYIKKCQSLLKPNGLLGLQMILFPDHRYDDARKNVDWIQKHIFPGSLLPSLGRIQAIMKQSGNMGLYDYKDITPHYVKTLKLWREEFNSSRAEILELGRDQRFIRKWNYYWSYCEAAFQMRHISVAQAVFARSNNCDLHDEVEVQLTSDDQKFIKEIGYA